MNRMGARARLAAGDMFVSRWGQITGIRSMQTGTITLNNATSATATITAVDLQNSIILYQGMTMASTSTNSGVIMVRLELTNATTVTVDRFTAEAVDTIVPYTVIEFNPGVIKSVQRGTIDVSGGNNTATITAVDVNKSCVMWLGSKLNATGGSPTSRLTRLVLTNATTVTCSIITAPGVSHVTGFQVVEFY